MNKWIAGVLLVTLFSLIWPAAESVVEAAPPPIYTNAEAAALIDVTSGRILHSSGGDKPMRIASLTKIMTAIVAIEHGELSDSITVSRRAFGKEGSSIYLKLGEEMSLHHLLYGLMLRSGNDAAVAIAEHVGGSLEGFVYLMNQKAEELGMDNSQFMNPHGLDEEGHYSTANDMAKLTAYALKNPVFQEIVKTERKRVSRADESWDTIWYNKNKMLHFYEGADGVKTGYTRLARRCLVSSATRNGQQLAVVTLNDPNDWVDHRELLDYGFQYFPLEEVVQRGASAQEGLVYGSSFSYALAEGEREQLERQVTAIPVDSVDYRFGERGRATFYLNGKTIGSIPLYEANSLRLLEQSASGQANQSQSGSLESYWQSFYRLLNSLFTLRR
ncbi:D-alanyl-D-alanine carboxypeptidase family protein [Paenibacillus senegalensis]|uniref:D-alanyl-D-alanine carboxypeptidase family protein n=1 Tax=Paenibacillus senegalensis TaxID=1465766 RepID=UPI000287CE6F|nr:D-alanyl-D-alanine carboxypeptidase family protein [Paenibacillus senegalensis]